MSQELEPAPPATREQRGLGVAEWAVPIVILTVCSVVTWMSLQMSKAPEIMVGHSMQPRSFPIFLMALIVVLTGVMTFQMLRDGPITRKPIRWQTWLTGGLQAVFAIIAMALDMFLALGIVMFAICYSYGEKRIWVALAVAVLTPLSLFFSFDFGLGVRFPRGILTELYY